MYRERALDERTPARFWYGPFPVPSTIWAPALICTLLAPFALDASSAVETLSCERAALPCQWQRQSLLFDQRRYAFPVGAVRDVRFVDGLGKNRSRAETVLVFDTGHELRVASDDRDEARERYRQIAGFFGGAGSVLRDEERPHRAVLLIGIALAVVGVVFTLRTLTRAAPFRISVSRRHATLKRFPFGRRRELDLSRARRIRVGEKRVEVLTDRGLVSLAVAKLPKSRAHERVAVRLREALELDAPNSDAPRPAEAAKSRWRKPVLISAAIIAVALVLQGVLELVTSSTQGTLELECRTRCRFQGMECLPGGSVAMKLEPGTYAIEVWAAQGPELWRPKPAVVRVGERTRFVCEQ